MTCDEGYLDEQVAIKKEKDKKIFSSLTDVNKQKIREDTVLLEKHQNKIQDLSVLPTITIDDLPRSIKQTPIIHEQIGSNVPLQLSPQPTNGLVYFKALVSIDAIPLQEQEELKPYIPIFCKLLTSLGASGMGYRDFSQQTELYTDGLSCSSVAHLHPEDPNQVMSNVYFSSYCLERNTGRMFDIWCNLFSQPCWDEPAHIKTLLSAFVSDMEENLLDGGHRYAHLWSASSLNNLCALLNLWEGIPHFKLLQQLSQEEELDDLLCKLKKISTYLLQKEGIKIAINAQPDFITTARRHLSSFINNIPVGNRIIVPKKEQLKPIGIKKTFVPIPSDVSYTAMSFPTVNYTHPDFVPLQVVSHLMTNHYLHSNVREKGGAYGVGTLQKNGVFGTYSYRDPNDLATVEHYSNAIQFLHHESKITDELIAEAKLMHFSDISFPVTPENMGYNTFVRGITDEMKQRNMDILFSLKVEELIGAVERYLLQPHINQGPYSVAILGNSQRSSIFASDPTWSCLESNE
eukprot:TRINITY_DN3854_c0_g1_i5.p1 TRINITY_DN3854_c0_g1~~TRINITY_DN3854_c0_g1_i5.p1  ORF type:complete len:518 (-),score=115.18 TRINITY_DN3854_c0_g1_i5:105-1658(-)